MQTILGCTPMWNQITTRQTAFPVISKLWKAKLWKDCKLLFFFVNLKQFEILKILLKNWNKFTKRAYKYS